MSDASLEAQMKELVWDCMLRVDKLERQMGYSTAFLVPVDHDDVDALLGQLTQRVIWLEQFSGERPCPQA